MQGCRHTATGQRPRRRLPPAGQREKRSIAKPPPKCQLCVTQIRDTKLRRRFFRSLRLAAAGPVLPPRRKRMRALRTIECDGQREEAGDRATSRNPTPRFKTDVFSPMGRVRLRRAPPCSL
eukprot:1751056-Pleurochrysis_carterae.AAC.4